MNAEISNSSAILNFYRALPASLEVPAGIEVMNPFTSASSIQYAEQFYTKFYNDNRPRALVFGINPGRFGGGITGIPFTDPIRLSEDCGIPNDFQKRKELSAGFIYSVVRAWGGATSFYGSFFITALSPLGFTRNGTNLNYYDDKKLLAGIEPFMVKCIREQQRIFKQEDRCICLGEGSNYAYFNRLNQQYQFFKEIIPLPHPRWIMQYRRKYVEEYIDVYISRLGDLLKP